MLVAVPNEKNDRRAGAVVFRMVTMRSGVGMLRWGKRLGASFFRGRVPTALKRKRGADCPCL